MYLVKLKPHANQNAELRDRGDGVMKKLSKHGVLFIEAPNDPDVEVSELSEAEAKAHAAKMKKAEKEATLKGTRERVAGLRKELADLEAAEEDRQKTANAAMDAKEKEVKAAEKELAELSDSLGVKQEPPPKDQPKGDENKGQGAAP
ncbi:MAG TPA: hypothetical protein VKU80_15505 [Planctomycetota bacterium]|nr:hypothetical protein [Planctomycetota bacterium]